jgi:hypothetical protein
MIWWLWNPQCCKDEIENFRNVEGAMHFEAEAESG